MPVPNLLTTWSPADPDTAAARRETAHRLADALRAASFTVDSVNALLGPVGDAALGRGERVPALRATADGSRLSTLIRLFALGAGVPGEAAGAALGPLGLDDAVTIGLLEPAAAGEVRAAVDLRPYAEADSPSWWVLSDLGTDVRPGPARPDHVLGIGGASVSLARATVRHGVRTALDIGTGCGVQALHLSRHAERVTATDVNDRALALAAFTAELCGQRWELLAGSLAEPVAGRRFDLVVSNPPFVIGAGSAGTDPTYTYRDSGFAGDAVCRRLIAAAPDLLAEGGRCQLLANWMQVRGTTWEERVGEWVEPTGLDAWVVQREIQDPAEYVALWLRDAGEEGTATYAERYDRWLEWLVAHDVESIGFGLVTLRNSGSDRPIQRIEELRQPIDAPLGPEVAGWFDRQDWLRERDTAGDLLDARLRVATDVVLEQRASAGAEGWEVDTQTLVLDGGLRWRGDVDQIAATLVGGSDGKTRLGDQLAVLATAYGYGLDALVAGAVPAVRHLVERGFLLPA